MKNLFSKAAFVIILNTLVVLQVLNTFAQTCDITSAGPNKYICPDQPYSNAGYYIHATSPAWYWDDASNYGVTFTGTFTGDPATFFAGINYFSGDGGWTYYNPSTSTTDVITLDVPYDLGSGISITIPTSLVAHDGDEIGTSAGVIVGAPPVLSCATSGDYSYTWSPDIALSPSYQGAQLMANPTVTTTYTVTETSGGTTVATKTVVVYVGNCCPMQNVAPHTYYCSSSQYQALYIHGSVSSKVPAATRGIIVTGSYTHPGTGDGYISYDGTQWTFYPSTGGGSSVITPDVPFSMGDGLTLTIPSSLTPSLYDAILIAPGIMVGSQNPTPGCSDASAYSYMWSPLTSIGPSYDGPDMVASPTVTTTYTVTQSKSGVGVVGAYTVVVDVDHSCLTANAGSGFSSTLGGSPTASGGVGPYTYSWIPLGGLSSASVANPVASPSETTTYTLTVTDANEATASSTVVFNGTVSCIITSAGRNQYICPDNPYTNKAIYIHESSPAWYWDDASNYGVTFSGTYTGSPGVFFPRWLVYEGSSVGWEYYNGTTFLPVTTGVPYNLGSGISVTIPTSLVANDGDAIGTEMGVIVGTPPSPTCASSGDYTYTWSPNTGLSPSYQGAQLIANPTVTTTYTVTETSGGSVVATETVIVYANNCCPMTSIAPHKYYCSSSQYTAMYLPSSALYLEDEATNHGITFTGTFTGTSSEGIHYYAPNWVYMTTSTNIPVDVPFALDNGLTITIPSSLVPVNNLDFIEISPGVAIGSHSIIVNCPDPSTSYTWSPSTALSPSWAGPYVMASPTITTTYTITQVKAGTVIGTETVIVEVGGSCLTANAGGNCSGTLGGSPTASGGAGPYTYLWTPSAGLSSPFVSNPAASPTVTTTYTVIVTDANGGTASSSAIVGAGGVSASLSVSPSQASVPCNGMPTPLLANGPSGAVYTWAPSSGLSSTSGRLVTAYVYSPVIYTVTVVSGGCVSRATANFANMSVSSTQTNAACDYSTYGSIHTEVTFGNPPYYYSWNIGQYTPDVTGLYPGFYEEVVSDNTGCSVTKDFTINPSGTMNVSVNTINDECNGTGEVDAIVTGGTTPYSYLWSPSGVNTPGITGQYGPSGGYVQVTDANGCFSEADYWLLNGPIVNGTVSYGPCGVAITLAVSGGVPPYTYYWDNGATTRNIEGIGYNGTQGVTVWDANGCSNYAYFPVDEPVNPLMTYNYTAGNGNACGAAGSIDPNISGGLSPYKYAWSDGTTTEILTGVSASYSYDLTVTDVNGCSVTTTITDGTTSTFGGSPSVLFDPNSGGINICAGSPATFTVQFAGDNDISYQWQKDGVNISGATTNTYTISSVADADDGYYQLIATNCDGSGYSSGTYLYVLDESLAITTDPLPATFCQGYYYYDVSASATGDNIQYQWLFNGAPISYATGSDYYIGFGTQANSGDYALYVYNDCSALTSQPATITFNPSNPIIMGPSSKNVCYFSSTTLSVNAQGTNLQYQWYLYGNPISGATNSSYSLPYVDYTNAGDYYVYVSSDCGTEYSSTATVTIVYPPFEMLNTMVQGIDVTIGGPTYGGISPYSYKWSPSSGLSATNVEQPIANPTVTTTYTLIVMDANGCSATSNVTVNPCVPITADAGSGGTVCGSYQNYVMFIPAAGFSLNGHNLSSAGSTYDVSTFSGITVTGTYTGSILSDYVIQIDESLGISAYDLYMADDATPIALTPDVPYNLGNGLSITVPTSFINHMVDNTIPDGSQIIIHSDFSGLTWTGSAWTGTPGGIMLGGNPTASGDNTCGSGYSYSWSPSTNLNSTTVANPICNLGYPSSTTTYTLVVTDNCTGCIAQSTVVVSPSTIFSLAESSDHVCLGSSISFTTWVNTGPEFEYRWSPVVSLSATSGASVIASPTVTTTYGVVGISAGGCSTASSSIIHVNTPPVANAGSNTGICPGSSATIGNTVTGGSSPYTYNWSPSSGLSANNIAQPTASPTATTTYTVIVTDHNGCTGSSSVVATLYPVPSANAGDNSNICQGGSTTIGNTATGGSSPYTYNWSPSSGLSANNIAQPTASPTATTTYTVTVTDNNGCTANGSAVVTVNPNPTANAGSNQVICSGSGVVIGTSSAAIGGSSPYNYSWLPSTGLSSLVLAQPTANPTITTSYTLTISDNNGCTANAGVNVSVNSSPILLNTETNIAIGPGSPTIIGTPASNGTSPFYYSWSPVTGLNSTSAVQPLVTTSVTTTYSVIVTDYNGCTSSGNVNVVVCDVNAASPAAKNYVQSVLDQSIDYFDANTEMETFLQIHPSSEDDESGLGEDYERYKWFWDNRVKVSGQPGGKLSNSADAMVSFIDDPSPYACVSSSIPSPNWEVMGPKNLPDTKQGSGLVSAIYRIDDSHILAASNAGGLWKGTKGTKWDWTCLTDGTDIPVLGIQKIAVKPNGNNDNIWLGTGTNERGIGSYGVGLVYSTNSGSDWNFCQPFYDEYKSVNPYSLTPTIGVLAFNPGGTRLFASVGNELFYSDDDGATWTQSSTSGVDSHTVIGDIDFLTATGQTVFISGLTTFGYTKVGVWKSTDGGQTFSATPFVMPSSADIHGVIQSENVMNRLSLSSYTAGQIFSNAPGSFAEGNQGIPYNLGTSTAKWHKENTGIEITPNTTPQYLVLWPYNPSNLYGTGTNAGWRSFVGGSTYKLQLNYTVSTGDHVSLILSGSPTTDDMVIPITVPSGTGSFTTDIQIPIIQTQYGPGPAFYSYIKIKATGTSGNPIDLWNMSLQPTSANQTSVEVVNSNEIICWYVLPYSEEVFIMTLDASGNMISDLRATQAADYYNIPYYGIKLSPADPNVIYNNGTKLYRYQISTAGTSISSSQKTTYGYADGTSGNTHADVRCVDAVTKSTSSSGDDIFIGTDGGVGHSTDGGGTWSNINGDNLVLTEFFGNGVSDLSSGFVVGGAQDNGGYLFNTTYPNGNVFALGDNYDCEIDKNNDDAYYEAGGGYGSAGVYRRTSSSTFFHPYFKTPVTPCSTCTDPILPSGVGFQFMDPVRSDRSSHKVFLGGNQLIWFDKLNSTATASTWDYSKASDASSYVPGDHGNTVANFDINVSNPEVWYMLYRGSPSCRDPWQGVNILFKGVHNTTGTYPTNVTWTDISSLNGTNLDVCLPPTDVVSDPLDPNRVWVTFGGFFMDYNSNPGHAEFVNGKSRVFYTDLGAATPQWYDVSAGLPDLPVNTIVYQQGTDDVLYVGTDIGVYVWDKNNTGSGHPNGEWECYNEGLPKALISQLRISYCDNKLVAATFGRGMWETDLYTPTGGAPNKPMDITSSVTWDNSNSSDLYLATDVMVESGSTLEIKDLTVHMAPNRKFSVKQGGRLIIDHSTITNDCGKRWWGIDVWGNPLNSQPTARQANATTYPPSGNPDIAGVLLIRNNSLIEHAQFALNNVPVYDWGFDLSNSGGYVGAESSTFQDNLKDIGFESYEGQDRSAFISCIFKTTDFSDDGINRLEEMNSFWDDHGVTIAGCTFENDLTHPSDMDITCIRSIDADYDIDGYCIAASWPSGLCAEYSSMSKFSNFLYAIKVENTSNDISVSPITINGYTFNNCNRSIFLSGVNNSVVTSNTINVSPTSSASLDGNYGLYLEACNLFTVQQNTFSEPVGGAAAAGAYFAGCNTSNNNVFLNNFTHFSIGIGAIGSNSFIGFNGYGHYKGGLHFTCNTFTSTADYCIGVFHIDPTSTYPPQWGSIPDQGDCGGGGINAPAGNKFVSTAGGGYDLYYDGSSFPFNYYHQTSPSSCVPGAVSSGITLNTCTGTFTSDCSVPGSGGGGGGGWPGTGGVVNMINTARSGMITFLQQMDGGNTQTLLNGIYDLSVTSSSLASTLLASSPYLSDEVLTATINRTSAPLTDVDLTTVMVNNAPLSYDVYSTLTTVRSAVAGNASLLAIQNAGYSSSAAYVQNEASQNDLIADELEKQGLNHLTFSAYPDSIVHQDTVNHQDSVPFFLNAIGKKWETLGYLIMHGDTITADSIANGSGDSTETLADRQQLMQMHISLWKDHKTIKDLGELQQSEVSDMALGHITPSSYLARNTMDFLGHGRLPEYIPLGEGGARLEQRNISTLISSSDFNIIPNPASDKVIFSYDVSEMGENGYIEIFDLSGKERNIIYLNDKAGSKEFNTSALSGGLYIVVLYGSNGYESVKKLSIVRE